MPPPSDSTASSLASNTPFRNPNRSSRPANSDVRPAPPSARALSMRTLTAPLPLSFRGSPVFGSRLAVQRRWSSPRGSWPCRPPACRPRLRPRPATIGTPVPSISTRTRSAEGASGSTSSRSNACTSWPIRTLRRWRVDFGTSTPARFLSLRLAASYLSELAASAQMLSAPGVAFLPTRSSERSKGCKPTRHPRQWHWIRSRSISPSRDKNPFTARAFWSIRSSPASTSRAAHFAAVAPVLRDDDVALADDGRMLRRRLIRQTSQIRHRVRMAELLFLAYHMPSAALARMRGARRARVVGNRIRSAP